MNLSGLFIDRPVATTLLTIGVALAGIVAFFQLPVSPLPQVDYPTISVQASLPGASPDTMAATVATPLERALGRIAGVTEMTSSSSLGSTRITLQFELDRDIDGAARDVQAAINAARNTLPTGLPSNPTYRKVNPADAPIMLIALTSDTLTRAQMYDAASTIVAQKLSQVTGIGQVTVAGSALPAVRVELNPAVLNKYGIGFEDVRTAITSTNANRPKGAVEEGARRWQIGANDQAFKAAEYAPIIVAWRNGAPVRLSDLGEVVDSVQDIRNAGSADGKPAVLLILNRQPGANIIETVDRVRALLPQLRASIPDAIDMKVVQDRTPTIRASLREVERALIIAFGLVIVIVFAFLRNVRAALIPSVAVPVSLIGTFGVMYVCGYSLDNVSLMALTVATGFVVDDAIVVLENITRYREQGIPPLQAALRGAKEVAFTVVSMSLSLIAVFIPILLMGGMVGRLFREFAVALSVAILISLLISLTTTPMMCAVFLRSDHTQRHGRVYKISEHVFNWTLLHYERSLSWALRHPRLMLTLTLSTIAISVYLFVIIPKGFFPQQDSGRLSGNIQAAQDISFQAMRQKLTEVVDIVKNDPAVDNVIGFSGGGGSSSNTTNTGRMFVGLKPLDERKLSADQVIGRLRGKLAKVPGAPTYLQATQDLRIGGRSSSAQYQYTLQGDNLAELNTWAPRVDQKLRTVRELVDVNSDQQDKGVQSSVVFDRNTASRLGITPQLIDDTLYDAFGQRQVSIMYTPLNQYHVVMGVAQQYWQHPGTLHDIYVRSTLGTQVPLSAVAHYETTATSLAVNHQGQFPGVTFSFNLAPNVALGDAVRGIETAMQQIGLPGDIRGSLQGTAKAFQESLSNQPLLILAALVTVYIVLGILYESYIHPITILSTLPSAGVGALLALLLFKIELSTIALIGIFLLIGIVKKNAIMMIDFALQAERTEGKNSAEAIYEACVMRFRPIMMTTMAALLGALPLALGTGVGSELRRPLGIAIVGGLLVSQLLTLYTTPVVYLYLDRLRLWLARVRDMRRHRIAKTAETHRSV